MRARNLKPGFFKNEVLGACSPLARLLFAGLWCLADRAGRLEDRPARIRAEVLPYDDVDADALLGELAEREFIIRYTVGGQRYIQIARFAAHQRPHPNERPTEIPDIPACEALHTMVERASHHGATDAMPRREALGPESLNPESLNPEFGVVGADASAGDDATTTGDAVERTAQILASARFVGDDLADVRDAVARSFELVPAFDARAGPVVATAFVRYRPYRAKPPDDWYVTWCKWLRKEVQDGALRAGGPDGESREAYRERQLRWVRN